MEITTCCGNRSYYLIDGMKICSSAECQNYLGSTEVIVTKNYSPLIYSLIFTILLLFPIHESESYNRVSSLRLNRDVPVKVNHPKATLENVLGEIRKSDILCSEHVYAQIKLESANLTSFLFKRTNNMLGMRYPYRRSTTAVGIYLPDQDTIVYGSQKELLKYRDKLSYAAYANWMDAVKDYKLWQDQNFNVEKRYLDFLKNNYAEDPRYIEKVKGIAALVKQDS